MRTVGTTNQYNCIGWGGEPQSIGINKKLLYAYRVNPFSQNEIFKENCEKSDSLLAVPFRVSGETKSSKKKKKKHASKFYATG